MKQMCAMVMRMITQFQKSNPNESNVEFEKQARANVKSYLQCSDGTPKLYELLTLEALGRLSHYKELAATAAELAPVCATLEDGEPSLKDGMVACQAYNVKKKAYLPGLVCGQAWRQSWVHFQDGSKQMTCHNRIYVFTRVVEPKQITMTNPVASTPTVSTNLVVHTNVAAKASAVNTELSVNTAVCKVVPTREALPSFGASGDAVNKPEDLGGKDAVVYSAIGTMAKSCANAGTVSVQKKPKKKHRPLAAAIRRIIDKKVDTNVVSDWLKLGKRKRDEGGPNTDENKERFEIWSQFLENFDVDDSWELADQILYCRGLIVAWGCAGKRFKTTNEDLFEELMKVVAMHPTPPRSPDEAAAVAKI